MLKAGLFCEYVAPSRTSCLACFHKIKTVKERIVGQLRQEGHWSPHQSSATHAHILPVVSGVVASLLVP